MSTERTVPDFKEYGFLASRYFADVEALRGIVEGLSVKQKRALYRVMRCEEHNHNRTDVFVPSIGLTLGEFCFIQLTKTPVQDAGQ